MRDDWSDYLRALGFTEPLMERAEIVVRFYTEIVQIDPAFLFVSEYRDETRRVFDSLWLCNEGTISEAKKFATENHFDCIRLRKRIDGWEVRTTNFDWVSPKEDSRLTVNIQLGLGIAGKLQASSDNCARLVEMLKTYIVPNLAR